MSISFIVLAVSHYFSMQGITRKSAMQINLGDYIICNTAHTGGLAKMQTNNCARFTNP